MFDTFDDFSCLYGCLFGSIRYYLFSTVYTSTRWKFNENLTQARPRNNPRHVRKHLVPCRVTLLGTEAWRRQLVGLAVMIPLDGSVWGEFGSAQSTGAVG